MKSHYRNIMVYFFIPLRSNVLGIRGQNELGKVCSSSVFPMVELTRLNYVTNTF